VGRSSRKRKHDDRMKQKRAEKAAKAAKYKALAGTSKRANKGWPTFREWPEIGAGALWEREYAGANPVSLTSEC
jgi:hypothetical protein